MKLFQIFEAPSDSPIVTHQDSPNGIFTSSFWNEFKKTVVESGDRKLVGMFTLLEKYLKLGRYKELAEYIEAIIVDNQKQTPNPNTPNLKSNRPVWYALLPVLKVVKQKAGIRKVESVDDLESRFDNIIGILTNEIC